MTINDVLKPCPFCGAEACIFEMPPTNDRLNDLWIVGCDGVKGSLCPCYIWKCSPFYYRKETAIRIWNERAEHDA